MAVKHAHELHVGPLRERSLFPDLCAERLPIGREVVDENCEVWITHRAGHACPITGRELHGERLARLRRAHIHFELERSPALDELAGLYACAGEDVDGGAWFSGTLP